MLQHREAAISLIVLQFVEQVEGRVGRLVESAQFEPVQLDDAALLEANVAVPAGRQPLLQQLLAVEQPVVAELEPRNE